MENLAFYTSEAQTAVADENLLLSMTSSLVFKATGFTTVECMLDFLFIKQNLHGVKKLPCCNDYGCF